MNNDDIKTNVSKILSELPDTVTLVAAGKTRSLQELETAIQAGVTIIGHNYVQEAQSSIEALGPMAGWHFIGHLQRNKAKKAVELFDLIETVDSIRLADALNKAAEQMDKVQDVLIEVNSAEEKNKAGVMPKDVPDLTRYIAQLKNLRLQGLMTMGPWSEDPEDMRPYFRIAHELFESLSKDEATKKNMLYLSMGMSDSYKVAIEEGANLVRIGTAIFGPR